MEVRPGYKLTEVGTVPEDWEISSLSSIADKIMVGIASAATHAYRAKGIPMFRNQNIRVGQLDDTDLLFIAPEYEHTFRNKRLKAGDLLTARTGYPGVTAIVPPSYSGAQSFTTLITRPAQGRACGQYLCVYINSPRGQDFFQQSQIGGAQKNLNAGTLRKMLVPLPKLDEQKAIADTFSNVDALLDGLERLIAKKRDLKQATMQQLLTGQTRLPGFTGAWGVTRVGELGRVVTGGTPSTSISRYWGGPYPWITPTDISPLVRDMYDSLRGLTQEGLAQLRALPKGSVLVTCIASIGKNAILKSAGACNQQINALIPEGNLSEFLFYLFDINKPYLMASAGTTATSIISKATFSALEFRVPALSEQVAIAEVLSGMDAELAVLEQRLTKTHALKQAMVQELLTGKIRLV